MDNKFCQLYNLVQYTKKRKNGPDTSYIKDERQAFKLIVGETNLADEQETHGQGAITGIVIGGNLFKLCRA